MIIFGIFFSFMNHLFPLIVSASSFSWYVLLEDFSGPGDLDCLCGRSLFNTAWKSVYGLSRVCVGLLERNPDVGWEFPGSWISNSLPLAEGPCRHGSPISYLVRREIAVPGFWELVERGSWGTTASFHLPPKFSVFRFSFSWASFPPSVITGASNSWPFLDLVAHIGSFFQGFLDFCSSRLQSHFPESFHFPSSKSFWPLVASRLPSSLPLLFESIWGRTGDKLTH